MPDAVCPEQANRLRDIFPTAPLTGMDRNVQAVLPGVPEDFHKGVSREIGLIASQVKADDTRLYSLGGEIGYLCCQRRAFVAVDTGDQARGDAEFLLGVWCVPSITQSIT